MYSDIFNAPLVAPWALWLIIASVKTALLIVIGLVAYRLLRRSKSSTRYRVCCAVVLCAPIILLAVPTIAIWRLPVLPTVKPVDVSVATNANLASDVPESVDPAVVLRRISKQRFAEQWSRAGLVICSFWVVGCSLVLSWQLVGFWRLFSCIRESSRATSSRVLNAMNRVASKMNYQKLVRIRVHSESYAPFTVGWLRPLILLPQEAENWETQLLESILAHELAHIQRRDWLTQQAANIACVFFWFNPLIWRLRCKMLVEREFDCDQQAIQVAGDRFEYASHLMFLAENELRTTGGQAVFVISGQTKSTFEQRIAAVVQSPGLDSRPLQLIRHRLPLFALAVISIFIVCISPVAKTSNPEFGVYLSGLFAQNDIEDYLVERLNSHDAQTREAAARMLGFRGYNSSVPELIEVLDDSNRKVRVAAIEALGHIGDPSAAPPLAILAVDSDSSIRAAAKSALNQLN